VEDAPNDGPHRAQDVVATEAVGDNLAANTILLRSESKRDAGGPLEVVGWSCHGIVVDPVTEKLNILEPKGSIVIVGAGVFPRSKKEKEGNNDHVEASLDGHALTAKIFG